MTLYYIAMATELETKYEKQLARVESVDLFIEDHGILTCFVNLHKEEGLHQGFGGYSLDGYDKKLKRRIGTAGGMDWVLRLLQIFHVDRLEKITGKMCYALYERDSQLIKGIETLELDGKETFLISEWQKQWFPDGDPDDD